MTASMITTPCTRDDCAIGGYTGATCFVLVGWGTLPPTRIAPCAQPGGGGGGGGGGGAAATPPTTPPTTPPPPGPIRPPATPAPTGPPWASRRVSLPGANANVTSNVIGASAGGSYIHCRTASVAAFANAALNAPGALVPGGGGSTPRATRPPTTPLIER